MPPAFMYAYMIANKQNPLAGLFGETTLATCGKASMAPLRLDGEHPLAAASVKTIEGIPLAGVRTVGKGETVLLNFTLSTAWDTAADPAACDRFLLALLARRGIAPEVEVRATPADRAVTRIRRGSGFDLVSTLVPAEAVGKPLTLDLRGRARHIYRDAEGYCGHADRISLRRLDIPWVQFALFDTPQAAPLLELSATRLALGGAVQLDLRPLRENGVYLLDVRGPRDFREVIHCDGKRTGHDIRLALNDKPGIYAVTLKDMTTALTRETRIEAVANPQLGLFPGQD